MKKEFISCKENYNSRMSKSTNLSSTNEKLFDEYFKGLNIIKDEVYISQLKSIESLCNCYIEGLDNFCSFVSEELNKLGKNI